jgi:hypothetical protein
LVEPKNEDADFEFGCGDGIVVNHSYPHIHRAQRQHHKRTMHSPQCTMHRRATNTPVSNWVSTSVGGQCQLDYYKRGGPQWGGFSERSEANYEHRHLRTK